MAARVIAVRVIAGEWQLCPAGSGDVVVAPAGRLRCAARSAGARPNSLRGRWPLRSDKRPWVRGRSALRAPPAALCCSPPRLIAGPGRAQPPLAATSW